MHLTNTMSATQVLKSILSTEKKRLSTVAISALLCTFSELLVWVSLYLIIKSLVEGQINSFYFLAITGALFVRYSLYTLSLWQAHLAAYQIIQRVRQYIVKSMAVMSADLLLTFHRGDLEKRLNDDCQNLEPLIAHHTTDIINGIVLPLLLSTFLIWIDWRLGLIALTPLPLALLAQITMMRGFSSRQAKYNQVVANMHQAQLEFLRSIGVMKLFAVDTDSYHQLSKSMNKHHKLISTYTKQIVGSWVTFVTLAQTSLMLVIPFAIHFSMAGSLSLTELVMAVMLCAGILKPWLDLTQIIGQVQQSMLSIDRMKTLFTAPPSYTPVKPQPLTTLSTRNLVVERGGRELVREVNIEFSLGDFVVLQGVSGSGKSSFFATLSGSVKPKSGGWFINDQPTDSISDDDRSKWLAVVDQSPVFFSGTLNENLCLSSTDTQEEDVLELLSMVGLADVVSQLPNGLNTDIGETQRNFSGGEIQRLAIVRAALARTPILILDEATSHLDNLTEQITLSGLRLFSPEQILLVISHRPYALQMASLVYQLTEGTLKEASNG
ncbi:ATP-binding cassette domain-containing protein [Vibrio sp. MA40-2]|uniref:ATP-binding cassette domain-containing protein n=1 Tax=Vibrio sp. MA40-2 TaxID=3391828 RepID=UPI0039A60FC8